MELSSIGSEMTATSSTLVSTSTAGSFSASTSTAAVAGGEGTVDTFEASWQLESTVYSMAEVELGSGVAGIAADAQLLELIIGLMLLEYLFGEGGGGGASGLLEMALMGSILDGAGGEADATDGSLDGSSAADTGAEAEALTDPAAGGTLDIIA
ncbi:MAG: hypothetical protein OER86_08775 [Phycisphaerae bacterium]|nr:hypothetical protein [Phycisphaerae bacterium]